MRNRPTPGQSGKTSTTIINAVVALAFIAFCAVVVLYYFGALDQGKVPPTAGPAEKPSSKVVKKPTGYLDITFNSSSAKKRWIDQMAAKFNSEGLKTDGKTVRVTVHHDTSGGSYDALKAGKIKPDIWSPGDESWLHLAGEHWKEVRGKTLFDEYTPLVNIPLVIAMWEPMAKALGYPDPIGWKDIRKLAANPDGWAALNRPEWGKFRWGHAHPDANSGFLAVISMVYAPLGKVEGITVEDLRKPEVQSFLREFEGAVEHYGLSNSWIDDLMHSRGPSYLSAAVQYENTIIETNEKHGNSPFKLVAIYPTEGAFWTQHPAAVINEEWMTPEKRKACTLFIDFLVSEKAQRAAREMGLRPISNAGEISAPFDADHGVKQDIAGDKKFQVPSQEVLKRIRDLWENVKAPATISLLLDRSGSMRGKPLESAKEGAIRFIKAMKPRDQLEVVIFNHQVQVLTPFCLVRNCAEQAMSRIDEVFAEGETALYDAVDRSYLRLLELQKKDPKRRYGMIVLSDGVDNHSLTGRHDFLDKLPKQEDFGAPKIFTIAYGTKADQDLLKRISNRTNARLFKSSSTEIIETYRELSANF
ncbi:MAG: VWA domain-containing protein [Pseudomonadota bacterium]